MKRALAILGALFVCGAAATGYYQRWQPVDPIAATGSGPVLFDRDYIEFDPTMVGVPTSTVLVASNRGDTATSITIHNNGGRFHANWERVTIDPRSAVEIVLEFKAERPGVFDGQLRVEGPALDGGELELSLLGVAEPAPELAIEPRSIDFGPVAVGETRTTVVQFHNRGDGELDVSRLKPAGPFAFDGAPFKLAPRTSTELEVVFSPTRIGAQQRQLVVYANVPGREEIGVAVKGEGADDLPQPRLHIGVTSLSFGRVVAGKSSRRWVRLQNRSDDPLTISSVTVDGPYRTSSRSRKIAARGNLMLPVTFRPKGAGAGKTGTLTVFSNSDGGRPVTVALTGDAITREVALAEVRADAAGGGTATTGVRHDADGQPLVGGGDLAFSEGVGLDADGEGFPPPEVPRVEDAIAAIEDSGPGLEDGSITNLATHEEAVVSANVRDVVWDADANTIAIEGLQMPTIDAGLLEYYSFDETNIVATVDDLGEVNVTVPFRMVDDDGHTTVVDMNLTTDTAAGRLPSGVEYAMSGSPLNDGALTLVGIQRIPSGRLEGHVWRVVLNVRAR